MKPLEYLKNENEVKSRISKRKEETDVRKNSLVLSQDTKFSITIIVLSNRPKNFDKFISQFNHTKIPIVAIVDDITAFKKFIDNRQDVRIIETKSRNFSYLVNLGASCIKTSHFLLLGDDETVDSELVNFLTTYNLPDKACSLYVETYFGTSLVKMWSSYVPRLFHREVFFKRRLHEIPVGIKAGTIITEGKIKNTSYQNWNEYWQKASSCAKREQKSIKRFIDLLISPIYWYFKRDGFSDGFLGVKIVMASMLYAGMSMVLGIRGHNYFSVDVLEDLLKKESSFLTEEEADYLKHKLKLIQELNNKSLVDCMEELEQLSSPFLSKLVCSPKQ